MDEELEAMLVKVDRMAIAMKAKLIDKHELGFHGGLDPAFRSNVEMALEEHTQRQLDGENQAVDIANLAMMLWKESRK